MLVSLTIMEKQKQKKQRNTNLSGEGRLGRSDFERAYMEIINSYSV